MKNLSITQHHPRPLWELFFQLTFISSSPFSLAVVCSVLSKLFSLAQPLMLLLFTDTSSTAYWSDIASYLVPAAYFKSDSAVLIFACCFFAMVQLFVVLAACMFYRLARDLWKEKSVNEASAGLQLVHGFAMGSAQVLVHVAVSVLSYLTAKCVGVGDSYSPYKHLTALNSVTVYIYIAITLLALISIEVIITGVLFLAFCQDRGMRKRSFWSANTGYHALASLCFSVYLQAEFPLNLSTTLAYALRTLFSCAVLIALVLYSRYPHYYVDICEFFFSVLQLALSALILAVKAFGQNIADYARYPPLLVIFSFPLCVIRVRQVWRGNMEMPRNEPAAVESLRWLATLATEQDRQSLNILLELLGVHSNRCRDPECDCRKICAALFTSRKDETSSLLRRHVPMQENFRVFLSDKEIPQKSLHGLAPVAFRVLARELSTSAFRGEDMDMLMAEVEFYLFGNHYAALGRLEFIAARKPRLDTSQRVYNLRRTISVGFDWWKAEDEAGQTLAAMEYLRYYHKFLDQVEKATDSTIKFWAIVKEDEPSSTVLDDLGKLLFRSKYKVMGTVEKISRVASNHFEFLVCYGLFMRFVMHDLIMSEQIFQKISFLNSTLGTTGAPRLGSEQSTTAFSLFRLDTSVMLIAAHMDHTGAGTVTELNTAVEQVLGYSRKDLLGASVLSIMPPVLAQKHNELVSKFFRTMHSYNMGVQRAHFLKTKGGMYVLCICMMRVVPRLTTRVELAMFATPDRKQLFHTKFKKEPTERLAGAILCVPKTYAVIGFTKEAVGLLRIPPERLTELEGTISLLDIFPWLSKPGSADQLFENEGRVFAYKGSPVLESGGESAISEGTLFWGRLVAERADESLIFLALVLSEIRRDQQHNYAPDEDTGFYVNAKVKEAALNRKLLHHILRLAENKKAKNGEKMPSANQTEDSKTPANREIIISDVASVASVASMGSSEHSMSNADAAHSYEMSQELQLSGIARRTPTTIKWLSAGMLGMLLVVVVLIFVNAYVALQEVTNLSTRFDLIAQYHLRYKASMVTAYMSQAYINFATSILGPISIINSFVQVRANALNSYNVATRKLLFSQKLDYDGELIYVTDVSGDQIRVAFSYAIFMLINANVEYSVNDDAALSVCKETISATVCQLVAKISQFAYKLAIYPIRTQQDAVSRRLESELADLSRHGESTQYIITCICLALIVTSAAAVLPIFVWVIKDKSQVLAIFADISPEEASRIIEESRTLDIKNMRYKRKWIQSAEERHEAFWKKLATQHKRGFGRASRKELCVEVKDPMLGKSRDKLVTVYASKDPEAEEEVGEAGEENENQEQLELDMQMQKKKLEEEAAKKLKKRRERLGEIDYALRRMFIIRLTCVLALFFAYTCFALYFNKYVHDNNSQASTMLFALCKRSVYPHVLNTVLVEAFNNNNSAMAGSNPDPNGPMYTEDVAAAMFRIEAMCREFRKTGPSLIYRDYFTLVDQAEGPLLCNISDAASDVDTTFAPCYKIYNGPPNGLYAGISWYLELHTTAAQKFITTNFSNSEDVAALKTINFSIVVNVVPSSTYPLSFVLGKVMIVFYDCATRFFAAVNKIVYGSSIGFVLLFVTVYVVVFARFIAVLNDEIWHTRGMMNMIPVEILNRNPQVRELVWRRRVGLN